MSTADEGHSGQVRLRQLRQLALALSMVLVASACVTVTRPTDSPLIPIPTSSAATSSPPEASAGPTPAPTAAATASPAPTPHITPSPPPPPPTFDQLKAAAVQVTYHELISNGIDYVGRLLYFNGQVVASGPSPTGTSIVIEVNEGHDVVYMRYTGSVPVSDGAWIEFVGAYSGLATFNTDGGGQFDRPSFQSVTTNVIVPASEPGFGEPSVACADRAHKLPGYSWNKTYSWSFQKSSLPDGYDAQAILDVLQLAVSNITEARNDCGLADNVAATESYLGDTTHKPGITARGRCGATDHQNEIGFGHLPPGMLGVTCIHSRGNTVFEADIVFTTDVPWALSLDDCTFQEMLEAVATHEFGHAFGLGHVGEAKHGLLTMSTDSNGRCRNEESTLGLGDVLGLQQLY